MRRRRIKAEGEGVYHVTSRIVGKRFWIDENEKRILLDVIRRAEAFSGVEVYTYAVMSNHFHLLVRVPERAEVGEEELRRRLVALYGEKKATLLEEKWERWEKRGMAALVAEEKERFRARMHDVSQFCKTFKSVFSIGYNKRHKNTGSPWEGRFKSVLVEPSREAVMTVSGYIHLNPVRAEMADEASKAGNAGFGAACQGDMRAREGLRRMVEYLWGQPVTWAEARAACGGAIEGKGREAKDGRLLHRRVPGFTSGGALGSREWAERVAGGHPAPKRKLAPPAGAAGVAAYGLSSAFAVRG